MNKTGQWGEILTARYLRAHGAEILMSNFRCRFGEADLICAYQKHLVFVEVKARSANAIERPAAFVDKQKQQKLILTASYFLSHYHYDMAVRFDVAEVIFESQDYTNYQINYIEDAFRIE